MSVGLYKQFRFCDNRRQKHYEIEKWGKKNNIMEIMSKLKNIVGIIRIKGIKILEKEET